MNTRPLVSVGLAVYNGESHIRQAIESVLSQDYTNFELVISDNASTDKTPLICGEYRAHDYRIRYHRNDTNIGAIANFNKVFQKSFGEYFMWASHDDYRRPSYISTCLRAFSRSGNIVLTGTWCDCVDEQGNLLLIDRSLSTVGMTPGQRFQRYKRALHEYSHHRGGIFYGLYRRDALERVMPLQRSITADQNMMLALCLIGEFDTVPERLLTRRMSGASNQSNSLRALSRSYGITNPLRVYGAYVSREVEIDKMLVQADIGRPRKAQLVAWSALHTFSTVGMRVLSLSARRLRR